MKCTLRTIAIILLISVVFFMSSRHASYAETAAKSSESSEYLAIGVFMVKSNQEFLVKNLEIGFRNMPSLPFNTSIPAFNDYFQSARFSVVSVGAFLRVSYNLTLGVAESESNANGVLSELEKAFAMPISVTKRTYVVNNETESIDVYYQLSGIGWNAASFEELLKYCPKDGFGKLVTGDLLGLYLQVNNDIENEEYAVYGVEYNLTRTGNAFGSICSFSAGHRVAYQRGDDLDVSLNEVLNHTGPITPSIQRPSQVFISIDEIEHANNAPLRLTFNNSSPPYTTLEESNDVVTLTYNLTGPVDNIFVAVDVEREGSFSWIYLAAGVVAASVASVAIFFFVKSRRKTLSKG